MTTATPPGFVARALLLSVFCLPSVLNAQIADVQKLFRSGDTATALETLDQLRITYPDDVDYMLLRAQIYAQQGRDSQALEELRKATSVAPDYEEPWRLRYVLLSRVKVDVAESERREVEEEVAVRFPEALWWQVPDKEPAAQWAILLGAGHDRLDNGTASWNRQFFEVSRERERVDRHRLGVSRDQRFSNSDLAVLIGSDFSFADNWLAGLDYSAASDASFLPDSSYRLYLGRTFASGLGMTLAFRRRNFSAATVSSSSAMAEKYAGAFRFAYSLTVSHLHGADNSIGHNFTSNWYYSDRSSIGLSISGGEEAEATGPGQVLETRVRGVSVSGRRGLSERITLQWWLGLHDQGDLYRRQFLGMAVSIKL